MKSKSILVIMVAIIVALTYTAYSPALAYQPSNAITHEANGGQNEHQNGRKQDQNSDQNNKKKNNQKTSEGQNKGDKKDQNNENNQNKNQKNNDKKNHHQDQNHDNQQNQNNDQQNDQNNSENHNDNQQHHHNNDQNQQHNNQNDQHHDQPQHQDQHHHHEHDDQDQVGGMVMLFGALLFQEVHERSDARHVLQRTAVVLEHAQELGRQENDNDEYDDNYRHHGLGFAFSYQLRAQELFQDGRYQDATFYSLHARNIALRFIQDMEERQDYQDSDADGNYQDYQDDVSTIDRNEYDEVEIGYWQRCPSESELSIGLEKWFVSDDDALRIRIELNFK